MCVTQSIVTYPTVKNCTFVVCFSVAFIIFPDLCRCEYCAEHGEHFTAQYSVNMADEARDNHMQQIERAEIGNLVRSRMESLNLPSIDYDDVSEKRNHLSYVIINPSCDLKLEEGDIM